MNEKKLIIIARKQFGYSNVYYHWCKYLSNEYKVEYLCPDMGLKKILPEYIIKVIYVQFDGRNKIIRNLIFFFRALQYARLNKNNLVIVSSGMITPFIGLFTSTNKILLDIRVGHKKNKYLIISNLYRIILRSYLPFYQRITVLSQNLAAELKIPKKKYTLIPLGSDIISKSNKQFNDLSLLYIGTFNNRNISETIKGFSRFYNEFKNKVKLSYTVIGFGNEPETEKIIKTIKEHKIENVVKFVGRIQFNDRSKYFDNSNVGVSYIPMTDYFDVQPPTKTFEYILSGIPVIATATSENKKIINQANGVLIQDTAEAFYNGLKRIYRNRNLYNSSRIRESFKNYQWENIVKKRVIPTLNEIEMTK